MEFKGVLEENNKQREYIKKLESQLNFLNVKQNDEITKVEATINEFAVEIRKVKDENASLKTQEGNLIKDIETFKEEKDKYKKEYKNLKHVNKALEQDLREIDNKVKDFIREKNAEIAEHNKELSMHKQVNSKLKVLEDIQGMIKSHRVSQRSKFDISEIN